MADLAASKILYFDSVDTGFIQLDKKLFPRIKHYNRMILHALVKANNKVEGGRITFGLMKVKESSQFSINVAAEEKKDSSVKGRNWIFEELAQQAEGRIERSMKLHEDLTSDNGLTEDRKIKLMQTHRSVEKFMLTVATAKVLCFLQKHKIGGCSLLNETVSSLDQVLASVRDNFARASKRKSSPDIIVVADAGTKIPDLNMPFIGSSENVKVNYGQSCVGVFLNEGMLVKHNPYVELDNAVEELRRKKIHLESNLKKVALPIIRASNPFEFRSMYPTICNETIEKGYKNMILCFKKTLKSPWIIHDVPKHISLTGEQVVAPFHRYGSLKSDGFQIVTIMMAGVERSWIRGLYHGRWRHILLPIWAEKVLNGEPYLLDEMIRLMFTDKNLGYDVECCRVIFVPHQDMDDFWSVYAINMETCRVHVFDPKRGSCAVWDLEKKHRKKCYSLIEALSRCVYRFFGGWHINAASFKFVYHSFLAKNSSFDSAFYVLHCMMNYEGSDLARGCTEEGLKKIREYIVHMVLTMEGNIGVPPKCIVSPMKRE